MARLEEIQIEKKLSIEELKNRIKKLEKNVRFLKRLYFILYRYQGDSVEVASKKVGVTKMVGYIWQKRWNESGYDGLIPNFGGGRPSRLTAEQKEELKSILMKRDDWTPKEIADLIKSKYGVEYSIKHVSKLLKKLGMHYSKPYQHDYRRPRDAEHKLKKLS